MVVSYWRGIQQNPPLDLLTCCCIARIFVWNDLFHHLCAFVFWDIRNQTLCQKLFIHVVHCQRSWDYIVPCSLPIVSRDVLKNHIWNEVSCELVMELVMVSWLCCKSLQASKDWGQVLSSICKNCMVVHVSYIHVLSLCTAGRYLQYITIALSPRFVANNRVSFKVIMSFTLSLVLFSPPIPLFEWGPQSKEILLNLGMKCWV